MAASNIRNFSPAGMGSFRDFSYYSEFIEEKKSEGEEELDRGHLYKRSSEGEYCGGVSGGGGGGGSGAREFASGSYCKLSPAFFIQEKTLSTPVEIELVSLKSSEVVETSSARNVDLAQKVAKVLDLVFDFDSGSARALSKVDRYFHKKANEVEKLIINTLSELPESPMDALFKECGFKPLGTLEETKIALNDLQKITENIREELFEIIWNHPEATAREIIRFLLSKYAQVSEVRQMLPRNEFLDGIVNLDNGVKQIVLLAQQFYDKELINAKTTFTRIKQSYSRFAPGLTEAKEIFGWMEDPRNKRMLNSISWLTLCRLNLEIVPSKILSFFPNLERLTLGINPIIQVDSTSFASNKKLVQIELENLKVVTWKCNDSSEKSVPFCIAKDTFSYLKRLEILYLNGSPSLMHLPDEFLKGCPIKRFAVSGEYLTYWQGRVKLGLKFRTHVHGVPGDRVLDLIGASTEGMFAKKNNKLRKFLERLLG